MPVTCCISIHKSCRLSGCVLQTYLRDPKQSASRENQLWLTGSAVPAELERRLKFLELVVGLVQERTAAAAEVLLRWCCSASDHRQMCKQPINSSMTGDVLRIAAFGCACQTPSVNASQDQASRS